MEGAARVLSLLSSSDCEKRKELIKELEFYSPGKRAWQVLTTGTITTTTASISSFFMPYIYINAYAIMYYNNLILMNAARRDE